MKTSIVIMKKIYMLIIFLILSQDFTIEAQTGVPVFIIDYQNVLHDLKLDANPFSKMSTTKFVDLVHETIRRSEKVLIFVEIALSAEDLSLKDDFGSPYHHLANQLEKKKLKYIPSVHQPYRTLKRIFEPQQNNILYLRFVKHLIIDENYKYYYVHFEDVYNETRAQKLRRHDLIMQDLYDRISKFGSGPMLAFYTAQENPIATERIREKSHLKKVLSQSGTTISSDGGLIHLRGVSVTATSRHPTFLQPPAMRDANFADDGIQTTIAFTNFDLQFNFSLNPDRWVLDSIAILECGKEVGSIQVDIGAAYRNSYVCGVPLRIVNNRDGSIVTISHYQIQAYHPEIIKTALKRSNMERSERWVPYGDQVAGDNNQTQKPRSKENNKKFGNADHCTPFFTPGILCGLIVSFLCIGIMMWGIIMLMDIKTMDRFDNPRNKPLVINVND